MRMITPWNFPCHSFLENDARAHQWNTVVLKPAEDTPFLRITWCRY